VDDLKIYPRYKLGDFVRCAHVYYNYHYYFSLNYSEPDDEDYYHGIILDIDYACWDGYEEDYEVLYIVYCTDGIKRFFSEDEVSRLA
jgi:hypothetical protein